MKSEELYDRIFGAIAGGGSVELSQEEAINLYGELVVVRGEDKWAPVDERCRQEDCKTKKVAKGYCRPHYQAATERGEFGAARCLDEGCAKFASARGLCRAHYYSWNRDGRELPDSKLGTAPKECSECGEPAKARGLCSKHYMRARRKK